MIWQLSLLSSYGTFDWMYIVFVLFLIQSILEVGDISGWMEVTIYAYMFIFLSLVCMDGWHMCLLTYHIHALVMHLDFFICIC